MHSPLSAEDRRGLAERLAAARDLAAELRLQAQSTRVEARLLREAVRACLAGGSAPAAPPPLPVPAAPSPGPPAADPRRDPDFLHDRVASLIRQVQEILRSAQDTGLGEDPIAV